MSATVSEEMKRAQYAAQMGLCFRCHLVFRPADMEAVEVEGCKEDETHIRMLCGHCRTGKAKKWSNA